ncbi:hypothetical protein CBL_13862 [Carabus blaptoides fortunei]
MVRIRPKTDWSSRCKYHWTNWRAEGTEPGGNYSEIQTAFGDDVMGIAQIKRSGATGLKRAVHRWRASHAPVVHQHAEMTRNCGRGWHQHFSGHSIMTEDLAMKRVAAKFVPKLLTAEHKQPRVEVSQDMLNCTNSDPDFMNTIIPSDKS